MIPVRLQLKNFMSYGEGVPPLELAGVRLACLSGDNGNGKTALLDAITWALFDKSRAKSKDDVIRLGANDCAVMLDFLVDGSRYRVRRQIGRKTSASLLELQIRREDGSYHPLSGTNQDETKQKIEALLRMNYETFLSTAYLAQGRADEFARATPNKRKEVLADILDLSRYDRLEEMAKEREKEAKAREEDVTRTLAAIDANLANRDRYEMLLEDATRRLTTGAAERTRLTTEREHIALDLRNLDLKEQTVRQREEKITDAEELNAEDQAAIDALLPRITQAEALVARKPEILAAYARFNQLEADIARYEEIFRHAVALERECNQLTLTINQERENLDRERYNRDCEAQDLQRDAETLTMTRQEITSLEQHVQAFGDIDSLLAANVEAKRESDERMAELKGENNGIAHAVKQIDIRLDALTHSNAALCEYCGSPLPPEKRQAAIADAERERAELQARIAAVKRQGAAEKQAADRLLAEADALRRQQRDRTQSESRLMLARQTDLQLSERVKQLPQVIATRDDLARRLSEKNYALEAQEKLGRLSREREKAEAEAAPRDAASGERNALRGAPREYDQLGDAEQFLLAEPPKVAERQLRIADRAQKIARAKEQVAKMQGELTNLPLLRQSVATFDTDIAAANETVERANRDIGQWTSQIEFCKEQEKQKEVRQAELMEAVRERELYRELSGAFGKKGVQALIIENALPEIMGHANELLGRLSNDAMKVELRTTREAKTKGGANIETLDIIISDDAGTRPYEMFSGGESFRVNFALRVALSRVLASRAGAPLQTLIVDEGFGTQDPRGREAITDALQAIQEYFALILCITHIEEIKEAFPTRIEVVKGPSGSTFTVV